MRRASRCIHSVLAGVVPLGRARPSAGVSGQWMALASPSFQGYPWTDPWEGAPEGR